MKFKEYLQIAAATIIAALCIKLFVLDAVVVSSPSMENTLLVGDLVLVNKLVDTRAGSHLAMLGADFTVPRLPMLGKVDRGDVIVFKYPGGRDEAPLAGKSEYVKRCI